MIREIIPTFLGGAIAGGIGLWAAWRQRRRDGRDKFIAVICELEAELDECKQIDDQTVKFHIGSLVRLRSAVFALQPFVSEARFERLRTKWHEYKNEDKLSARDSLIERTAHELNHGEDSSNMLLYSNEKLRSYLKIFREQVS